MSPSVTFLLTLAGVLLVGLPLPVLTRSAEKTVAEPATHAEEEKMAWAVVSFTGNPRSIRLRPVGGDWQEADCTTNRAETELAIHPRKTVEIEVKAEWDTPEVQALSLSLEPVGHEARTDTQWKEEDSNTLHSIFTFRW